MLAARYYAGIDSFDEFSKPIFLGGRDSECSLGPLLNRNECNWIEHHRDKILAEVCSQ